MNDQFPKETDVSEGFIKSGMRLITSRSSDALLDKSQETKEKAQEDKPTQSD